MTFTISSDQLKSLDRFAVEDFHRRLVSFIRKQLPEETTGMNDTEILQRILESERRAAMYGINSEVGIAQWVCLTFLSGLEFDESPNVRAYLCLPDAGTTSEDRLNHLIEELAETDALN